MAGGPDYPDLRRIAVWLEDQQEALVLLTNNFRLAASTIAAIYKDRRQVELFFKLFFKLLKQQVRIKTLVGTSAHAVRVQVLTALVAAPRLRYLQYRSGFKSRAQVERCRSGQVIEPRACRRAGPPIPR